MKGNFVVIDSGDGSGKETQVRLLADRLRREDCPFEKIDFPQYESYFGQWIRATLDGQFGDPTKIDPRYASWPYTLDRWAHASQIKKWLKQGKLVVADRFYTANILHQGAKLLKPNSNQMNWTAVKDYICWLTEIEFGKMGNPVPDKILYLHVTPADAQHLMNQQGRKKDGHEVNLKYAQRVEQVGLWACEHFGWTLIECCPDGDGSLLPIGPIHKMVWEQITPLLPKKGTDA